MIPLVSTEWYPGARKLKVRMALQPNSEAEHELAAALVKDTFSLSLCKAEMEGGNLVVEFDLVSVPPPPVMEKFVPPQKTARKSKKAKAVPLTEGKGE